jgi:hypothetical protein
MSDQRPGRTDKWDDDARLLDAAARERLSVAAADLDLPAALRLSEWERSTVAALAAKIVRTVEDELRATLIETALVRGHDAVRAAFSSAHVSIGGPILERSRAPLDRPLVAALIRRADEHRRFRARAGAMPLLVELIQDADPAIAEQAMAILIAQSRRFDRFSEPAAARTELAAELEHRLVWRVAAALRHYMVATHGVDPVAADTEIVAAAERLLAAYDEGDSLEARSLRLARRLDEIGRLDDELIERTLSEGSLPLFLAAVAVRTGLALASGWEILSDSRGRGPVFLLKAAGVERARAASILLELASTEEQVPAQVDLFDVTDISAAQDALRLWRVGSAYRDAIAELRP